MKKLIKSKKKTIPEGITVNYLKTYSKQIRELEDRVNNLEKTPDIPNILKIQINDIQMDGYFLTKPIEVIVKFYSNEVLAVIPDLEIYGEGDNEIEAINELKLELVDLYHDLIDIPDDKLGKYPRSWKKIVCSLIECDENKKI